MTLVPNSNVDSLEGSVLAGALACHGVRPNTLVTCARSRMGEVTSSLLHLCAEPLHCWALPGIIALPERRTGTLLLMNVEAMTMAQQVALFDWLSAGREELQVVSVTTARPEDILRNAHFLEALFYRLNVLRLSA
jgi:transcriptional regulator of acetoin/glycerol metabolism